MTRDASVKAAALTYAKTSDTLDVLVNNAGVATGGYTVPSEASLADMHAVYEVNVRPPASSTTARKARWVGTPGERDASV